MTKGMGSRALTRMQQMLNCILQGNERDNNTTTIYPILPPPFGNKDRDNGRNIGSRRFQYVSVYLNLGLDGSFLVQ